jgi:ribosomal protein S3
MFKKNFKFPSLYQDLDVNNPTRGYLIRIGGRLKGISKAKRLIYKSGKINLQTTSAKIDYYAKPIFTK